MATRAYPSSPQPVPQTVANHPVRLPFMLAPSNQSHNMNNRLTRFIVDWGTTRSWCENTFFVDQEFIAEKHGSMQWPFVENFTLDLLNITTQHTMIKDMKLL